VQGVEKTGTIGTNSADRTNENERIVTATRMRVLHVGGRWNCGEREEERGSGWKMGWTWYDGMDVMQQGGGEAGTRPWAPRALPGGWGTRGRTAQTRLTKEAVLPGMRLQQLGLAWLLVVGVLHQEGQ
jgi:hypothetical protein